MARRRSSSGPAFGEVVWLGELWFEVLICFLAGAGAGLGTGFAGMSAATVISPMLVTFLGIPA